VVCRDTLFDRAAGALLGENIDRGIVIALKRDSRGLCDILR